MNSFYSNKCNKNISFILILIIPFLFLFSPIKSQEIGLSSEKALFNESLIIFNKTNIKLVHIKDKMSDIKYNIILLINHKNLIRVHDSINSEVDKIKAQLDKNKYDKNAILEEIQKLNKTITKFDSKCNKMMRSIKRNEEAKSILLNMIKIFFITLLIITIIVLSITGIVSFFVIRNQRRYYILHEEHSQDNIDVEKRNHYNNELNRIKAKNEETDSTDRKKIVSNESSKDKKTELESSN